MARFVGNPGESAAVRGLREWGLILTLIVVFLVTPSIWALVYFSRTLGALGILTALAGFFVAYVWRRRDFLGIVDELRDSGKWLKGAKGEYLVHKELGRLSDEFIVFNDFHPIAADGRPSKWNVDHVVVGPTGVFVLDAKCYSNPRVTAASANSHTKRNVGQAQRNALDLKNRLKVWSAGALSDVFVVPVVVYVQENARVDNLREGSVRVLPLTLLVTEIQRHTESEMNLERSGRIALALFSQLPHDRQMPFKLEFDAYVRATRVERRAAPRQGAAVVVEKQPNIPTVCPRCGGALVRKRARKGDRIGRDFLACETFHDKGCRYGFNLD